MAEMPARGELRDRWFFTMTESGILSCKALRSRRRESSYLPESNPIPMEKAVELCKMYRDKHKVRLFSQCWGCLKFSKEPSKMCFYNPPENRGCKLINNLFDS